MCQVQANRAAVLAQVTAKGYVDGYEGWRNGLKGTRFLVKDATVFNVDAPSGERQGQCAVIRCWQYEDGTEGGPGAAPSASAAEPETEGESGQGGDAGVAEGVSAAEAIAVAEAAVTEQAAVVRALKEEQGLGNGAEEVKAAVAELLVRKKALEAAAARRN
jgi:hypothetical protein